MKDKIKKQKIIRSLIFSPIYLTLPLKERIDIVERVLSYIEN